MTDCDHDRHYSDYIECDFCGRATRGRIPAEDPYKVYCSSCNRVIAYIIPQDLISDDIDE